ncbi:single-strand DNA-binding protein [Arthrobacter sp. UYNi723]
MSGETSITVIGNLTSDPELRFTTVSRGFGNSEGTPVANFTIASTPRTFDTQAKEWQDGQTLFLRATVWREAAENVAASLTKGSRVVVTGVLKSRTYETTAGEKRTVIELEVEEIDASLRYSSAKLTRTPTTRQDNSTDGGDDAYRPIGEPAPQYADDDAWFGLHANPDGRITVPDAAAEPAR